MSEKRFGFGAVSPNVAMIKDNGEPMGIGEVVDCLNEQQATISRLEEENEKLRKKLEQIYSFKGQNCRCDGV